MCYLLIVCRINDVAPFTGAWIEMYIKEGLLVNPYVAPFTGAWIEMTTNRR